MRGKRGRVFLAGAGVLVVVKIEKAIRRAVGKGGADGGDGGGAGLPPES